MNRKLWKNLTLWKKCYRLVFVISWKSPYSWRNADFLDLFLFKIQTFKPSFKISKISSVYYIFKILNLDDFQFVN